MTIAKDLPLHVAFIPDGNRRWARKRGFAPWVGHKAGVNALEKILEKALELQIRFFTFWASSPENLTKRSKVEVEFLYRIYKDQFKRLAKDKRIHQNQVKVEVIGLWQKFLPEDVKKAVKKAIEATKNYGKYFLTFLLAYSGVDEMVSCIQKLVDLAQEKKEKIEVTKELVKENLWTNFLPPVDLVIRTGCEDDPHLSSGFMMWDTAWSQFYFSPTLFPDFTPEEFEKIILDFSQRERRMGK